MRKNAPEKKNEKTEAIIPVLNDYSARKVIIKSCVIFQGKSVLRQRNLSYAATDDISWRLVDYTMLKPSSEVLRSLYLCKAIGR